MLFAFADNEQNSNFPIYSPITFKSAHFPDLDKKLYFYKKLL